PPRPGLPATAPRCTPARSPASNASRTMCERSGKVSSAASGSRTSTISKWATGSSRSGWKRSSGRCSRLRVSEELGADCRHSHLGASPTRLPVAEGKAGGTEAADCGLAPELEPVGGGNRTPGSVAAGGNCLCRHRKCPDSRGRDLARGRSDGGGSRWRAHCRYRDGVPMKGSSRRPEQMAETLRQVITDGLMREVRDPRVGFVTITGVLVTNDLSHARVMVSVPGEETEKARALEGLQSAAGF